LTEVDADGEQLLRGWLAAEAAAKLQTDFTPELFRLERLGMWTKLRPGVRDFLRRAHEKYELWIHTNGNRGYADAMMDLLDPQGTYFGGRIIAQGVGESDASVQQAKRLMAGLEGREPVAVILDDSSAVWPHDKRNLFVVERYLFFPSSRKRFGMKGKSLLEVNRCAWLLDGGRAVRLRHQWH
jgi:RNA polymerase II C-terminal domain phosphatase-like 3/4